MMSTVSQYTSVLLARQDKVLWFGLKIAAGIDSDL